MLRLFRKNPPPREAAHIDVSHDGETYRVALRRTAAAKRFTLRVRTAARDVVLTMPARASLRDGKSFAERNAAWIGVKLRRLPDPVGFEPGGRVPLRGIVHIIAHAPHLRRAGAVCAAPPACDGAAPLLLASGDASFIARRIRDFLQREARRDLGAAVERHASPLGVKVRKITLRDTTSRWGSCSASGALSFSWRLILAPPFILDYLAAHEVAHLVHMNHSDEFWALLRKLSPHVDTAEAWLKANGSGLLRFGGVKKAAAPPQF